jgi:hypothetical protein
MSVASGRLPSVGFVALCLVCVAVVLFFVWALRTPVLERVWTIHHLTKIGELDRLSERDKALLGQAMAEHEDLTRDLLDGHELGIITAHVDGWIAAPVATLLRTPESTARELKIDVQAPQELFPVQILVRGGDWKERREVKGHGVVALPLPAPDDGPEIVEVEAEAEDDDADHSLLGVRITWEAQP